MTTGKNKWTRRTALTGAGALVLGGGYVLATREGDRGAPHSKYFVDLSAALHRAGIVQPAMVIDLQRLRQNIEAVRAALLDTSLALRIVVKSLPAASLVELIGKHLHTDRYMVFNGSMLYEMAKRQPQGDLLLGKPLPVQAAEEFYRTFLGASTTFADPNWLIDTPERLQQYTALARRLNRRVRVNFEIDVGLHRGGFRSAPDFAQDFAPVVDQAATDPNVEVTGLMGYDAHVAKLPWTQHAYRASQVLFRAAIDVLNAKLPGRTFTLNAAGSPTYTLHTRGTVANEVAIGSAFVKPVDFDIDTLSHHVPAAFIATPVIKALPRADMPGIEFLTGLRRFMDANTARAFFIYGGHWLARPESPPGLEYSSLFGRSSNQELLTGSTSVDLQPDDYVFLRPTQSEAVLLQFGDLLVYDGENIVERWPTFPMSA